MNEAIKRQVLPGGLWVVATPIGNLADLAPRARQALEQADAILCEDTRRTSQLLAALGISGKRLERLDAHASPAQVSQVAERLAGGESLALVSDAGTPAVSDPGAALVSLARERGVAVTPLPGPSAVLTLLSASGFKPTAFAFRGFFPRKDGERAAELELARKASRLGFARVFVWFESPERVSEALEEIAKAEPRCRVVAAKELTKLHERFFAGEAPGAAREVRAEIAKEGARGEWCFAIEWPESAREDREEDEENGESSDWVKALHCLLNARVSASGAAKQVSQHFGVARNRAYEKALLLAGKKMSEGD